MPNGGEVRVLRVWTAEERSRRTFDEMVTATSVELVEALQIELLDERILDPNEVSLAAMRRIDQLAGIDDEDEAAGEKPRVRLVGTDGNVFSIIARVAKALRDAGQHDRAREWVADATSSTTYDEVLMKLHRYVDVG